MPCLDGRIINNAKTDIHLLLRRILFRLNKVFRGGVYFFWTREKILQHLFIFMSMLRSEKKIWISPKHCTENVLENNLRLSVKHVS